MTDAEAMNIAERALEECMKDFDIQEADGEFNIEPIAKALQLAATNERERILKIVDAWWRFAEDQQPLSSWHDKQDCLIKIRQSNQGEK